MNQFLGLSGHEVKFARPSVCVPLVRGLPNYGRVAEQYQIQQEALQRLQQDHLAEEILLNWFPSLSSDSITQGSCARASQWQEHPTRTAAITTGMTPTAVPLCSNWQRNPQRRSLGEPLHVMLSWSAQPQLESTQAFAPPTPMCAPRVRQSRPSNQINSIQKTLHVGGLRARNKRGYLDSATHLLPPQEWAYQCRFCGRIRRSTSTIDNSSDNMVRIRCSCGGQRSDGKMRMHSCWNLSPTQNDDFG